MAERVGGLSAALSLTGLRTEDREVPQSSGSPGEQREKGARENIGEKGARQDREVPVLTQENLRSLEGRDPMAAVLLSVVPSLPPSETAPIPAFEKVANAKVRAWRKAGRKEKDTSAAPMFGTTLGEGFEVPYGEIDASELVNSSDCELHWVSREAILAKEPGYDRGTNTFPSWGITRARVRGETFAPAHGGSQTRSP